MSTSAPWNFQPTSNASGNVKLFNPGQLPQNDGNITQQEPQTAWGSGWSADNQYEQYNHDGATDGLQQVQDQNDYQGETGPDSQQFYNLNPGIQSYQGQGFQPYDPQGQYYQYDAQGQPVMQYDPQGQPIQNFDPQGQLIMQFDPQGQPIQNYDPQGQGYDWNNQWNQYSGYQENLNNTEGQQYSVNDSEFGQNVNSEPNFQDGPQSHNIENGPENGEISEKTENKEHESNYNSSSHSSQGNTGPQNLLEPENSGFPNQLHQEISDESLVTLNSSSTQLEDVKSQRNVENQMENLTIQEKSNKLKTNSGDSNHSAVEGQGSSTDNSKMSNESKDSPVNSQTSDDWEMVPPAHNLVAPNTHSRQSSADSNNVHFFIGSTNISPSGTPGRNETDRGSRKSENASPTTDLIPKHSSSPMPSKNEAPPSQNSAPPPSSNIGPPTGTGPSGGNPFRKGNTSLKDRRSPNPMSTAGTVTDKAENVTNTQSGALKLDIATASQPFPSPIPAVTDEISSENQPTQSPIMPRKESPFQPPRRRNISQSSNSFDDDHLVSPTEQGVGNNKSDDFNRETNSHVDRKNMERKTGPMKADRSIESMITNHPTTGRRQEVNIDYSKFSGHGKDEKRPRSPYSSSSDKSLLHGRTTPTKPPTGMTGRSTPTKPSSGRTTPGRNTPSRRAEHAAYQKVLERRRKENVSPATSLWANNDIVPKTNILLAPAAPLQAATPMLGIVAQKTNPETREVLSPVENLITTMSDHLSRENSPEKEVFNSKSNERDAYNNRTQKEKHERNSSIDREIEMTKRMEEKERRHEDSRERSYKDDRNYKGTVRDDRTAGYKDDRYRDSKDYRDRDYRDSKDYRDREREYERERQYEAYYERQRIKGRDPYTDERYERPRSRQSTIDDRAPSRQDGDKSRSDRDYYRDRYSKDYYNYYGNSRYGYYDQRYADYYNDSRYNKAYYDEYYGGQYPDNYDRMSRYDYTWQNAGEGYVRGSRASSRQGYADDYRGHYDPYYGYGYGDYYGNNSYMEPEVPGRMTPEKYTIPHMCARFGPGGHLIKVMPNRPKEGQTATVEIHDLSMMLEDRPEVEDLKCFPGPLVRGDTHKNDVLSFCQQKAKACSENMNLTDRESAELIWKLLELLIKQNGMVVGTDIADLLLEGHEPTTAEYSLMGMKISSSTDNLETELEDTMEISNVTMDRSVVNRGRRSTEEITDRFRHLLLYGRKKDALEWAMKNSLWGHALFLASKMDPKAHANVMTRFANSAMKMNDPLQTLYQLMSGRQPAAVSCITDERWGDWRPHLAMMLSNQTHKADLDRKCIMTMGDTLSSRGFLHGSHFCYLMAQAGFGSYHKKTSKMVLIGSNHSLSLSEFATNEAIQCSEVYEYAMSLGNSSFFSPNLQYFKFLYACRMAENGFAEQALEYCEVIAKYINISPTVFQPTLVKLVFELASRLKKFDPEKQQVGEDSEDPMWLQHLQRINQGYEDGSIQPLSGSATPYCYVGTRSSSASGEVAGLTEMSGMQLASYTGSPYSQVQGQTMYNQGYNTEQTQNQYYTNDQAQYQGQSYSQVQNQEVMHNQGQYGDQSQVQGYNVDQSYQHVENQQLPVNDQGQGEGHAGQGHQDLSSQSYSGQQMEHHQQNQQFQNVPTAGYTYQPHDLATVPESTNQNQEYSTENQSEETSTHQQINNCTHNDFSMYAKAGIQSAPGQRHSISSAGTVSTQPDTDDEEGLGTSHKSDFDYFGAATTQQKIVAPRLRKRTESESSTAGGGKPSEPNKQEKTEMKPEISNGKKNQSQSRGWFGGVFSKLIPKSKNEMKLPDDKDPAIVWDPVKKRWVNQDGDADDDKPAAPPPKDMDLSSTPAPIKTAASTPAMGPPTGNRFARPRGRGARTQYVDVMNPNSRPSGGTDSVPSNIFNVMPTSASSPAIFNPSNGKETPDSSQHETDTAQSHTTPSDQNMDSRESDVTEMPPPSTVPAQPMLFNPSQMSSQQSSSIPQSGLKRYNQRRVYPKS